MPLMANENIANAASVLASGRLWDARKASSAEHPTARAGAYPAGSPIGPVSWSDVDFIGLLLVIVQCTMTRLCLGLKVPRENSQKSHQYDATDQRGPDRAGEVATSFTVAGQKKSPGYRATFAEECCQLFYEGPGSLRLPTSFEHTETSEARPLRAV